MVFPRAQRAGNGGTLAKHCKAVAGHLRDALWVSLSRSTETASPKAPTFGAPLASLDKLTELAIILLKEH